MLKRCLEAQKFEKALAKNVANIHTFAMRIEKYGMVGEQSVAMEHVRTFSQWSGKPEAFTVPDDIDTIHYYYVVEDRSVSLYRDRIDKPETEEQRIKRQRREKHDSLRMELEAVANRHKELRLEFIQGHGLAKNHLLAICKALSQQAICGNYGVSVNNKLVTEISCVLKMKPVGAHYSQRINEEMYLEKQEKNPEYIALATVYACMEAVAGRPFIDEWQPEMGAYILKPQYNDKLAALYDFLTKLGYEMSDEEQLMLDGTHPLFAEDKGGE